VVSLVIESNRGRIIMAGKQLDVMQVPVIEEEVLEDMGTPKISGELHIRVYENGALELFVPETSKEFSPEEIENLTDIVHKKLYEQRIANIALDLFKQRLG
jgi:hypothetical protein